MHSPQRCLAVGRPMVERLDSAERDTERVGDHGQGRTGLGSATRRSGVGGGTLATAPRTATASTDQPVPSCSPTSPGTLISPCLDAAHSAAHHHVYTVRLPDLEAVAFVESAGALVDLEDIQAYGAQASPAGFVHDQVENLGAVAASALLRVDQKIPDEEDI